MKGKEGIKKACSVCGPAEMMEGHKHTNVTRIRILSDFQTAYSALPTHNSPIYDEC